MKRHNNSLALIAVIAAFTGNLVIPQGWTARVPHKPNILFIFADDLGWADPAYQGSDFYETPNINRLAREGMVFTAAYTCPNCVPTRAALLSGQYPPRTRVYNVGHLNRGIGRPPLVGPSQYQDLAPSVTTIAETLKKAGYITVHIGKYHVGGHEYGTASMPEQQGFDYNYGGGPAGSPGNYWAAKGSDGVWRFGPRVGPQLDPFAQPYDADYGKRYRLWAQPQYRFPTSLYGHRKHVGDALVDAAIQFIESHRHSNRPWYIQFHEYLVHTPLQPRPDLLAKYQAKKKSHPSKIGHDNVRYAAMVEQLDHAVGRLMAYLTDPNGDGDPSDAITNTLVVFYSDNGGARGSTRNPPLRGFKGMFYEGGIRVPLIFWMPGFVPHRVNPTPVIMVDFHRTWADLTGAPLPDPKDQPLDGVSLVPLIFGQVDRLPDRALYWHFPGYLDTRARPCSVITKPVNGKRYKLIYYYEDQSWELFNLTDDVSETQNLAEGLSNRIKYWNVLTNLSADLRAWLDRAGAIYPTVRATGETVPPPQPFSGPPPKAR